MYNQLLRDYSVQRASVSARMCVLDRTSRARVAFQSSDNAAVQSSLMELFITAFSFAQFAPFHPQRAPPQSAEAVDACIEYYVGKNSTKGLCVGFDMKYNHRESMTP